MGRDTRKMLGKAYAQRKTPHFEVYYKEFKEEIDKELSTVKTEEKPSTKKRER